MRLVPSGFCLVSKMSMAIQSTAYFRIPGETVSMVKMPCPCKALTDRPFILPYTHTVGMLLQTRKTGCPNASYKKNRDRKLAHRTVVAAPAA